LWRKLKKKFSAYATSKNEEEEERKNKKGFEKAIWTV